MNLFSEIEHPGELRHGLGPIWAAARRANPDFATSSAITFRSAGVFALSAQAWRENVFGPILFPALRTALAHARRGEHRELLALDLDLSRRLPASAAAESVRAGRRLAVVGTELRGERLLPRLATALLDDPARGHLAVVFAARCTAFSLPDRTAVGAYLFQEMCAGAPTARIPEVSDFVAQCLEPLGGAGFELRAA